MSLLKVMKGQPYSKAGLRSRYRRFLGGVGFLTALEVGDKFLSGFGNPLESFFTSHLLVGNSCWNHTISFETFIETDNSCRIPGFPL